MDKVVPGGQLVAAESKMPVFNSSNVAIGIIGAVGGGASGGGDGDGGGTCGGGDRGGTCGGADGGGDLGGIKTPVP